MYQVTGKVALVTGASKGLGMEMVRASNPVACACIARWVGC